jgi:predicted transcriptional regulator
MAAKPTEEEITRYADMFSAMGAGPRLRIMRLLLSAHPEGIVVGEIGSDLNIPPSMLSHHLEKLKNEGARARISGIRRTLTYCRSCWASSTPSAAPVTKRSNHRQSCASAADLRILRG